MKIRITFRGSQSSQSVRIVSFPEAWILEVDTVLSVFELISAYGTVGLSLGVPFANFSFSGALTPLSKLIVCAVMLRGRHRGLPVAIDRAVMLPKEFKKAMGMRDSEDDGTSRMQAVNEEDDNESGAFFDSNEELNAQPAGHDAKAEGQVARERVSFDDGALEQHARRQEWGGSDDRDPQAEQRSHEEDYNTNTPTSTTAHTEERND